MQPNPTRPHEEKPNRLWPGERFTDGFERGVLVVVQLLLMVLIVLAVGVLAWLLWKGVTANLLTIDSVEEFQKALQRGFAGVLLVLIGLELLETLRAYSHDHHIRLEVVLVVAVIALGRHIIQLDIEHLDGLSLIGIAALMLALMVGYFLARGMTKGWRQKSAAPTSDSNPEDGQR